MDGQTIASIDKERDDNRDEQFNNRGDTTSHNSLMYDAQNEPEELYRRIKRICVALTEDLKKDICIQESELLPDFVDLPGIIAQIYIQVISAVTS